MGLEMKLMSNFTTLLSLATNPAILFPTTQTKETPGYVRSYRKVEIPSAAKATSAAIVPNPPAPLTGARSFACAAPASSSSSYSWFRSFVSKNAPMLGASALFALGAAGALFYSRSGNADAGDDTKKRSIKAADRPFFNRVHEQKSDIQGNLRCVVVAICSITAIKLPRCS
jgi:hypothetical protein